MSDSGSFLARRARVMRREFAWRNKSVLLMMVALAGAVTALEWGVARLVLPWASGAILGAGTVGAAWMIHEVLRRDGTHNIRVGRDGEDRTEDALRRFTAPGFTVVNDVPKGRRNVDHALVGVKGLFAIESKATLNQWRVTERGVEQIKLDGRGLPIPALLEAARRAAKDLKMLVLAVPSRVRVQVVPVLVLWGPIESISGGAVWVDGVLVGIGSQAAEWMPHLAGERLSRDSADRCVAGLVSRRDEGRRAA